MVDSRVLRDRLRSRYAGAHRNAAVRLRLDLQDAAPYDRGELRASIVQHRTIASASGLSTTYEATAEHASFTNDGTEAHVIRPRRSGYPLKFYWPKVGAVVRFAYVNHPGTIGTKWWDKTLTKARYREHMRSALSRQR